MHTVTRRLTAIAAIVIVTLCGTSLWGCEENAEKHPEKPPLVGVLVYRQDDAYLSLVTKAIQDELSGKAEVAVFFAEGDQLTQNEQINALINRKASAFALNIVDPRTAGLAANMIQKANIPVIFFNREPDVDALKNYSKASFVGTNVHDAGIMQGDIIAELWNNNPKFNRNNDDKCQYLMIQASLDNPEAVARTESSVKRARENGIQMQQLGETLFCNWDADMAYEATQLVLPLYIDALELIIANNDSMALGAIRALNEVGYNLEGGNPARFIPVVGVDAIPPAVEAIRKGTMSGTVVQDGVAMGNAVATMVLNALGEKPFLEGLPYTWDESGIAVRIPYAHLTRD